MIILSQIDYVIREPFGKTAKIWKKKKRKETCKEVFFHFFIFFAKLFTEVFPLEKVSDITLQAERSDLYHVRNLG